jgi:DNA polymerase-1
MGYTFVESDVEQIFAYFDRFDTFAFDIETTGLNPYDSRILLTQFGFPDHQFVIDVAKVDITPLMPYLSSRKWTKIYFNGKFDEQFILHNYKTPILNVFDCMIAERVIAPESKWGNSLEDLALKYLEIQLDKSTRKQFVGKLSPKFTEKQIEYSADDTHHLFSIRELQAAKLKELQLEHIAELEFDLITVVANMELEGVPIDTEKWNIVLDGYREEHKASRRKMLGIFSQTDKFDQQMGIFEEGPETPSGKKAVNIGSPAQLKKAFGDLGISVSDTKEQTISVIKHESAEALLEYRGLDKIMTSYGPSFLEKIHPFTGRIHANWHQVGTETGRFSCSQPNLQQVPEKFRRCIGGEDDYVLLGADFSQMELRILAQESKDPILVEAFQTGKDIHSVTASTMFDVDIDKVTKEQRFAAKTLNFGITYGMKVRKFVDMMNAENNKAGRPNITIKQGNAMLEKYKETYRTANKYLEDVGLYALRTGMTMTRYGRKRFFTPVSTSLDPKAYEGQIGAVKRQGANMPIQGTNADITKMAMIRIHEDLRDYGFRARIVLQVHDEIVLLAHKSSVETIKPIVTTAMVESGQVLLPDIPVVVDAYVSEYWAK